MEWSTKEKPGESGRAPRFELRVSAFSWVILGVCALEVVFIALSLSLPWGRNASGEEIRFGLAGLLPWFAFVPVLIQLGFLGVSSRLFQGLYLLADFLIGAFILLVHYLAYVKYQDLRPGFYMMFVAGALIIAGGLVCLVERGVFGRLEAAGRARRLPVFLGDRECETPP
ncbi:MAG: hypothetical protein V1748_08355 [Actinomycetota bacterium]